MSLDQLQAQRSQILAEIQRRGGAAKAPNFAAQLQSVEAQIRQARSASAAPAPGASSPPAAGAPPPTGGGATGAIPSDFNDDEYYRLNPDVKAAGVAAREHYLANGMGEGRSYRDASSPAAAPAPAPGPAAGADLSGLQSQRTQILNEIRRRGGAANAPGFAKKLQDIEGQLRGARSGGGATAGPAGDQSALQSERTQILNEIRRRGGAANAPGFAKKLQDIEGRLRQGRSPGAGPGGAGNISNPGASPGGPGNRPDPQPRLGPPGPGDFPPSYQPPPSAPPGAPPGGGAPPPSWNPQGYQQSSSPDGGSFTGGADTFNPQVYNSQDTFNPRDASHIVASNANGRLASKSRQYAETLLGDPSQLTQRPGSGDLMADRQRIEDQTYSSLTRDVDSSEKRAVNQKEQELHNKGIQFNADPNSRYQQELKAIREGFAGARMDARTQAIQLGGQEYQRSFDIGEQGAANRLNELNTFSNLGEAGRQFDTATGEGMRQYDNTLGNQRSEFGRSLGEQSRQFDNTLGNQRSEFSRSYNRQNFDADREFGQRRSEFDRSLGEQGRQYDNTLGQRRSEYDRGFGEDARRFDANYNQRNREFDLNYGEGQRQFGAGIDLQNRQLQQQGRLTDAEREQQRELELQKLRQSGKLGNRQLSIEARKISAAMAGARGDGRAAPKEEDIFE